MLILREPDKKTLSLIPVLQTEDSPVLSRFVITEEGPGGSVLYNTLTGEIVFLERGEWPRKELEDSRFTVPAGIDEYGLCRDIRSSLAFFRDARSSGYRQFTILPTTDCNARCFYCYQRGCEHISMSAEDAQKTADFILRTKAPGKIQLRWFGGEPLFNSSAIGIICRRLSDSGVQFASSIVSNGYLFDEPTVKEAADIWKLTDVQIALDGTRGVYNKRKAYIYDDPDPFGTVISNMDSLLKAGIKVHVRLNADNSNVDDLKELCVFLKSRFENCRDLTIYSHPLFEIRLNNSSERAVSVREQLYKRIGDLDELIFRLGLNSSDLPSGVKLFNCMADSPDSIVLLPDGRIHACEQFNANHFFGTVDGGELKSSDLPYWRQLHPEHEECADCALAPQCIKLKHCPDINEECLPEERVLRIEKIRRALRKEYGHLLTEGPAETMR